MIFGEKTDDELKQLAIDLVEGKVYTDRHVPNDMIGIVFSPIALGAFSDTTDEELDQIGLVYEYLSEAGKNSINGLPIFFSFRVLNKEQTEKLRGFYNQYKVLKNQFQNANADNSAASPRKARSPKKKNPKPSKTGKSKPGSNKRS